MLSGAIHTLLDNVTSKNYKQGGVPQTVTLPYIVHFQVSNAPNSVKDAASTIDWIRYQVSIFAASQSAAEALAESVRAALDNYRGTEDSTTITSCKLQDENHLFEEDSGAHHIAQDYIIRVLR